MAKIYPMYIIKMNYLTYMIYSLKVERAMKSEWASVAFGTIHSKPRLQHNENQRSTLVVGREWERKFNPVNGMMSFSIFRIFTFTTDCMREIPPSEWKSPK